mmetsp:Transcript_20181/g.42260  ORF Transcript_20181/g.42260 Transcript_20181/m.42260 type:complete len:215 (-) Transcript_20181:3725-4369(-)
MLLTFQSHSMSATPSPTRKLKSFSNITRHLETLLTVGWYASSLLTSLFNTPFRTTPTFSQNTLSSSPLNSSVLLRTFFKHFTPATFESCELSRATSIISTLRVLIPTDTRVRAAAFVALAAGVNCANLKPRNFFALRTLTLSLAIIALRASKPSLANPALFGLLKRSQTATIVFSSSFIRRSRENKDEPSKAVIPIKAPCFMSIEGKASNICCT